VATPVDIGPKGLALSSEALPAVSMWRLPVHKDHISVQFCREDWVPTAGLTQPAVGEPWGGVSGSPLFAVVENSVISWRLAGVVTEFGSNFEILYASSLWRVRPDGSIPWSAATLMS